jgi:hypothetical protein
MNLPAFLATPVVSSFFASFGGSSPAGPGTTDFATSVNGIVKAQYIGSRHSIQILEKPNLI